MMRTTQAVSYKMTRLLMIKLLSLFLAWYHNKDLIYMNLTSLLGQRRNRSPF